MINKIIDGISRAIHAEFGEGFEIYTESVEQGLKEPCFLILCINPLKEQFLASRYFRESQFCIHFFPTSNEENAQCNGVRERLFDCLEVITVDGDLTRGTKVKSELSDGVLNFLVNYDMFIYKEVSQTPMNEVALDSKVRGDDDENV